MLCKTDVCIQYPLLLLSHERGEVHKHATVIHEHLKQLPPRCLFYADSKLQALCTNSNHTATTVNKGKCHCVQNHHTRLSVQPHDMNVPKS